MIDIDDRLDRASTAVRAQVNRVRVRPPVHVIRRQQRARGLAVSIGLAALILVIAVLSVLPGNAPQAADSAAAPPVEAEPVIVQGESGPNLSFDTNNLGTAQPLRTLSDTTRIGSLADKVDGEILQITVLGQTLNGKAALIVHGQLERDSRLIQVRCFVTDEGGACAGDSVNGASGNPDGLFPPGLLTQGLVYGIVGDEGVLAWEVPEDTSVVVLTINGTSTWQTPVSRVAVFDTDLSDGDTIELQALNHDGTVLDTYREIASNQSEPNALPMTAPDN